MPEKQEEIDKEIVNLIAYTYMTHLITRNLLESLTFLQLNTINQRLKFSFPGIRVSSLDCLEGSLANPK